MSRRQDRERIIHMISDSTGETVSVALNAVLSQFDADRVDVRLHVFVRTSEQISEVLGEIADGADLVVLTVLDGDLRRQLLDGCAALGVTAHPLLQPLMEAVSTVLEQAPESRPGKQYEVDRAYFRRVDAIDYAMSFDDGANDGDRLRRADVILIGVSRTSKTPTCLFLACRGIRAANIPLIPGRGLPAEFDAARAAGVPVIGLTASPNRLAQIRSHRLRRLDAAQTPDYADIDRIREEVAEARLLFERLQVPAIDVTRRSIEETAASIMATLRAQAESRD